MSDIQKEELTDEQKQELADAAKQEEYHKAYIAQIRVRDCPTCGEAQFFPLED
jgi:hypothetical protein